MCSISLSDVFIASWNREVDLQQQLPSCNRTEDRVKIIDSLVSLVDHILGNKSGAPGLAARYVHLLLGQILLETPDIEYLHLMKDKFDQLYEKATDKIENGDLPDIRYEYIKLWHQKFLCRLMK